MKKSATHSCSVTWIFNQRVDTAERGESTVDTDVVSPVYYVTSCFLMFIQGVFLSAVVTFSTWYICVCLSSVFHVILFPFIASLLCKMRRDTLPSDVFFLFQESRINCIRIARKGNSTLIFLLPQTLWPWMNSPALLLSGLRCHLLSCCSEIKKLRMSCCECQSCSVSSILRRYSALFASTKVGDVDKFCLTGPGCLAVGLWEKGNKQGGIRGQAFILFVWG